MTQHSKNFFLSQIIILSDSWMEIEGSEHEHHKAIEQYRLVVPLPVSERLFWKGK